MRCAFTEAQGLGRRLAVGSYTLAGAVVLLLGSACRAAAHAPLSSGATTVAATVAAATQSPVAPNPGATAWMMVSAALVMVMMPGLALFYGGIVRKKNLLAIMMTSYSALAIITLQWFLGGYALAFGTSHLHGFIGWDTARLFFNNLANRATQATVFAPGGQVIPEGAYCMFQLMFAIITPALIAGSVAERMKFSAWIAFLVLWAFLVYDPLAHAIWSPDGHGWIANIGHLFGAKGGCVDFAGGTVVEIPSGVSGLVLCWFVGKRLGYPRHVIQPNSLGLTLTGAGLLWFGWYGFNVGSAYGSNTLACVTFINSTLAAALGGLGWMMAEYIHHRRPTTLGIATGFIAGLVGITPACGFVTIWSAPIIGLIAGVVCYWGSQIKSLFGYDDSLDVFSVHAMGGFLGLLLTGVFASAAVNGHGGPNGLLLGNPVQLLWQLLGAVNAVVYAAVGTAIIAIVIDKTIGLRVPESVELEGLDVGIHGENGWDVGTLPEPAISLPSNAA